MDKMCKILDEVLRDVSMSGCVIFSIGMAAYPYDNPSGILRAVLTGVYNRFSRFVMGPEYHYGITSDDEHLLFTMMVEEAHKDPSKFRVRWFETADSWSAIKRFKLDLPSEEL